MTSINILDRFTIYRIWNEEEWLTAYNNSEMMLGIVPGSAIRRGSFEGEGYYFFVYDYIKETYTHYVHLFKLPKEDLTKLIIDLQNFMEVRMN